MLNIPYGKQWIEDDDIAAVADCLRGDWITQGPRVEQFEQALCAKTGAQFAVAVSSGTAALHLAALASGIGPGAAAITTPITFVASANCVLYAGGSVRFADVDSATGLIRVDEIARVIDEHSRNGNPIRLIVPVDLAGQTADLPAIRKIANACGAKVVEDAAHALGATYSQDGQTFNAACCAHTDMAILSFHPVKHITTGEGGAALTNDPALAAQLRALRTHGIHRDPRRLTRPDEGPWYYEQDALGYHYRLTDLQCALGLSQLAKLGRFIERRREIAARYDAALAREPLARAMKPLRRAAGQQHAYHLYVIQIAGDNLDRIAARRKALFLFLRERGIFCQVHYIPITWQPYYQNTQGTRACDCPGANAYYAGALSLPMYPKLSDAEQQRVIDALIEWAECNQQ
ncbi:MAG TPA: UDP-4-amino-4,6-dideoxy-N-acetyl-beta-L-altrosamine transaminase [Planctomycetota bacterium]|nr:UDP-4-amino-4,6-dideoxy-N-acetyl-beta-L-altrosamine transaminase [Planctomycetota bacterium]